MKKVFVLSGFCLTLFLTSAVGQIIDEKNNDDFDATLLAAECKLTKEQLGKIFTKIEVYAEFPGGFQKWFDFAKANFNFDYLSQHLGDTIQHFQDSIIVKFIVARNGTICNIKVQAGNLGLTEPTLKLLKLSPNWRPGLNGGRQLNSYRTLRLDILIDKKENVKTITL
ncbi:MAG: hypothetical protein EOP48_22890, partial [Sphingobacteriales bacterium]